MKIHVRRQMAIAAVFAVSMAISPASASAQAGTLADGAAASAATQSATTSTDGSYNGLALTPPMGYNDWYQFTCGINETTLIAQADALVSSGLAAKGYKYVNVDDCWEARTRDANGNMVADPVKFPHGMAWLADYLHSKGLKFGIYTSVGTTDCSGLPGSYGHYEQDAQTFADWGVDFVKFDRCLGLPDGLPSDALDQLEPYEREMSNALLATGRPIVFSYEYGPESWGPSLANMWRISGDLGPFSPADPPLSGSTNVVASFETDLGLADLAGPGHWNDLDMMMIGNTRQPYASWTVQERQTVMSIWSEMASPMLMSNDLTKLSADDLRILGNSDVIAVDQDPLGKQGRRIAQQGPVDIVAKPLTNGDVALLMVNTSSTRHATISTTAAAVGLPPARGYLLDDLWQHVTTETAGTITAPIPPNGSVMYRISPTTNPAQAPAATDLAVTLSGPAVVQGQTITATATLTNNGVLPIHHPVIALQAPAGWTTRPEPAPTADLILPGDSLAAHWEVTPPDAASGNATLAADATYGSQPNGMQHTAGSLPVNVVAAYPLTAAAPTVIARGSTASATTSFSNNTSRAVSNVSVSLTAPDGWTVAAVSPSSFATVEPGQTVQTTWNVTVPADAVSVGNLTATASFTAASGPGTVTASTQVRVAIQQVPVGNASFEDGTTGPTNWTRMTYHGAPILSWDTSEAHTGTHSVSITGKSGELAGWRILTRPSVTAGDSYEFGFWVKGELDTGAIAQPDVIFYNSAGAVVGSDHFVPTPLGAFDWTRASAIYVVPAGASTVRVDVRLNGGGQVWFDDISINQLG